MGGEYIDLVMNERPLREAMLHYSVDILLLSLAISAITAALVYLALHYMFVRPMRRVTANMTAFRADPENTDRVIVPSGRNDEIGTAESELAAMQPSLPRCCTRRAGSRRSASRSPRSTTIWRNLFGVGATILRSAGDHPRSRRAALSRRS